MTNALERLKQDLGDDWGEVTAVYSADLKLALDVVEAARYYASNPEHLEEALAALLSPTVVSK